MILDLRQLKRSGKDSGDFFFEYNPPESVIDIPSVKFDGAVKVFGTITLTGEHSAVIEGEIALTLKGECTRCLTETEKDFVLTFSESVDPESEDCYPVKNDTVDLSKIVDDVVVMNLPVNFLCSEDCKGICAGCGTNLNESECKCKN